MGCLVVTFENFQCPRNLFFVLFCFLFFVFFQTLRVHFFANPPLSPVPPLNLAKSLPQTRPFDKRGGPFFHQTDEPKERPLTGRGPSSPSILEPCFTTTVKELEVPSLPTPPRLTLTCSSILHQFPFLNPPPPLWFQLSRWRWEGFL